MAQLGMGKVHEESGYSVVIYTHDHTPPHVHVGKGGCRVKVCIADSKTSGNVGFKAAQIKAIKKIVRLNRVKLQKEWAKRHGKSKKTK